MMAMKRGQGWHWGSLDVDNFYDGDNDDEDNYDDGDEGDGGGGGDGGDGG